MRLGLSFFFFLTITTCFAQETYYSFQNDVYDETRFREKLTAIEQIYLGQGNFKYITADYKVHSMVVRGDSIIQNVEVILSQSNSSPLDINTGVQSFLNKEFPPFELQDLKNSIKTNTDYTGKVTLVNLWFTSCPPCITEIPYLNYLKDVYRDNVNFVAITFNDRDNVQRFLDRKPFNFEHLVDATKYLHKDLNNNTFPKLILLDTHGKVRFIENGVMVNSDMPFQPEAAVTGIKEQIDFLLEEN